MRVLILDDMEVRHAAFRRIYAGHEVASVKKYSDFLAALELDRWDLIHLDHDLGDEVADCDTYVDGWGATREYNGAHAAMRVCELSTEKRPDAVVIHSVNSVGAVTMMGDLRRAGYSVKWEPFGEIGECNVDK